MADLVIRAERAFIGGAFGPATVVVEGGRIREVHGADDPAVADVELGDDEVLLPGLVDTHVHINEPGRTEWEGFASATRAARAGGVTTIVDMPLNSIPPTIDRAALGVKRPRAEGQSPSTRASGAAPCRRRSAELRGALGRGRLRLQGFLAPSGVDEFPHLDRAQLLAALTEIAGFGGLLIVHAEDPQVLDAAPAAGGRDYRALRRLPAAGGRDSGHRRVHRRGGAAPVRGRTSCTSPRAAALPMLAAAKAEGVPITRRDLPALPTLAAEDHPRRRHRVQVLPADPGRRRPGRALGGAADGTIDLVVSDHSPSTADRKFAGDGDFGVAWGGVAGLQFGLAAVWTDARARGIPLETVLPWFTGAPADLVGLTRRAGSRPGRMRTSSCSPRRSGTGSRRRSCASRTR